MKKTLLFMLLVLPFLSGCTSCMSRVYADSNGHRCYPGTQEDALGIWHSFDFDDISVQKRVGLTCFALIDIPFSTVFDTLVLPFDLCSHPRTITLEERRELRDAHLREEQQSNRTSDGIRQPVDGLPKPSR